MAVTADRVIVELEAKLDKYEANVRRAEQKFDAATRAIAGDAKRMEREISKSTGAIGNQFKRLASTAAGAFSAQQVAAMADSYTRFTNQLKVAGLEGQALANTQNVLFAVAQKNGVQLEAIGTLYSRAAQNQRELGASSSDLVDLTRAVAASLKISGTSAAEAQGSLLQLGQALGSPRVQAEEFNSLLDTMGPLLREAAKFIDGTGGSLSGLTQRIKDTKGPGVTNIELFRGITQALSELEKKAESAQLTISGAFTNLSNALTKYIGEADQANGASAVLVSALNSIAENLDTVTAAISVLAAVMLGRFVAGMAAGAASTGVAGAAIFALQARAGGAATTMGALAFTGAAAGRALLAAFGGPIGLAVTALAIGIGYVAATSGDAAKATGAYATAQDESARISSEAATMAERLATAHGQVRVEALAAAKAEAENIKQKLASARASVVLAQAELARARAYQRAQNMAGVGGGVAGTGTFIQGTGDKAAAQAATNKKAAEDTAKALEKSLQTITAAIAGAAGPSVANVTAGKGKKGRTGGGATPTSPDEIARRFQDDLERAQTEIASAKAEAVGTAKARRDFERQQIEASRAQAAREILANKDYSAAQKEQLLALNESIAVNRLAAVKAAELAEGAQQALDVQAAELADAQDMLRLRGDLADTAKERRDIELRILDLQYKEEKLKLEAIAASATATEAEKEIARRRLAELDGAYDLRRKGAERANESPLEKYRRGMNKSSGQIQEQAEQWVVDELGGIQKTLSDTIQSKLGVKDPILAGVIDLFIEQVILKPLADAFSSASGGGGGGLGKALGSIFGSIFGRASGGHVLGGQTYRVNETGIEGFKPSGSGQIIPLGRMNGAGGGGVQISQTIQIDARNSVTPDGFADYIVARTRRETTYIVGEATKRVNRNVPARMAQYQRDGT